MERERSVELEADIIIIIIMTKGLSTECFPSGMERSIELEVDVVVIIIIMTKGLITGVFSFREMRERSIELEVDIIIIIIMTNG